MSGLTLERGYFRDESRQNGAVESEQNNKTIRGAESRLNGPSGELMADFRQLESRAKETPVPSSQKRPRSPLVSVPVLRPPREHPFIKS